MAGLASFVFCSSVSAEIKQYRQDGTEGPEITQKGTSWWQPLYYPTLKVSGNQGNDYYNTLSLNIYPNYPSPSIEFEGGGDAELTLLPTGTNSGIQLKATTSTGLTITGKGTLNINLPKSPTSITQLVYYSGIYLGYDGATVSPGGVVPQPYIQIGESGNPQQIALNIMAPKGIAVEGGHFSYYCPDSTITIQGGIPNESSDHNAGLVRGIIAGSVAEGVSSLIDITANAINIYLRGQSKTPDNVDMIGTTVIVSDGIEPPEHDDKTIGNTNITINVTDNITLDIDDTFRGYPYDGDKTLLAFGVYSESGVYYRSGIALSGSSFSFTSAANNTYGIYVISYGRMSQVVLDFADSIEIQMSSVLNTSGGGGISVVRYKATSQEYALVDLKAGKSIVLSNTLDNMVANYGGIVNISAPQIKISSEGGNAILNEYGSDDDNDLEGGKVSVTGGQQQILIFSNGETDVGNAISTVGNSGWQGGKNGSTEVIGTGLVSCNI